MEKYKDTLKILLGISDQKKDAIIEFLLKKAYRYICGYCKIEAMPDELEEVLISMCIQMYRYESLGQEESRAMLKGISEGDVSLTFDTAGASSFGAMEQLMQAYQKQLFAYRRAGW